MSRQRRDANDACDTSAAADNGGWRAAAVAARSAGWHDTVSNRHWPLPAFNNWKRWNRCADY